MLLLETVAQREHSLRDVFNVSSYVVRDSVAWRAMPRDLPPWQAVYDQAQCWLRAGCFENLVDDPHAVLRLAAGWAQEL